MKTLYIDIETYSEVDLQACGIYKYTQGEQFSLLLFAYSVDGGAVSIVDIASGERIPDEIVTAIYDDNVVKIAHNAIFERTCLAAYFARHISPKSWRCTLAQSARMGLPRSLDEASKAVKSGEQKSVDGAKLIRIFCTPQKPTKGNGMRSRIMPADAPGMWQQFKSYCMQDVRTTIALDNATYVGRACGDFEQAIYALDGKINDAGVLIDRAFAERCQRLDGDVRERLTEEAKRITGCDNPMSIQQLTEWLLSRGIKTYSLNAARVDEILSRTRDIDVIRVLTIRKQLAKISTSKYNTMLEVMSEVDNRARGLFQYYGTHTGRWAGRLIQLHNLPHTPISQLEGMRDAVMCCDLDTLELSYGNITELLSQLLRTAIVAPQGKQLVVCDYSAVEPRVLAWLAGEGWRLEVFRGDGKIYEATAAKLYKVSKEDITPDDKRRKHGKVAELALGYNGGVNALQAMGGSDIGLTPEQMMATVKLWREDNPRIVELWREIESVAAYTLRYNSVTECRGLTIEVIDGTLYITLPSGRFIAYPNAEHKDGKVYYTAEADYRKKGKEQLYGGRIVENIVQAIARDCLADVMLRLDAKGYKIVAHVHDEVVVEIDENTADHCLAEIEREFSTAPQWAETLPLRGVGFVTNFYKK